MYIDHEMHLKLYFLGMNVMEVYYNYIPSH